MSRLVTLRRLAVLGLLPFFMTVACTVRMGNLVDVEGISRLEPGVSTKADVLEDLGPPPGYGMSRLAALGGARTIWFYEYQEGKSRSIRLQMLLVFFDGEKYAGHLWFSGFHDVKPVGGE